MTKRCVRYTQPFNLGCLPDDVHPQRRMGGRGAGRRDVARDGRPERFRVGVKLDIPVAIELLDKAKYFMVWLITRRRATG